MEHVSGSEGIDNLDVEGGLAVNLSGFQPSGASCPLGSRHPGTRSLFRFGKGRPEIRHPRPSPECVGGKHDVRRSIQDTW